MKNFNLLIMVFMLAMVLVGCRMFQKELTAEEKEKQAEIAATLPLGVKIGGQQAVPDNEFCAKIAQPVSNAAEILVDTPANDAIVVTVTPATANGLVKAGTKPAIIIIDGISSSLNKTFSGQKLNPGIYIMRVNADNKISSILFEIK